MLKQQIVIPWNPLSERQPVSVCRSLFAPQTPRTHLGTHTQPCQHTAIQAWKRLSCPHWINQKFKAATYHSDSLFTYDENQRGAEIPSILSWVSPACTGYAARVRAADL